MLLHANHNLAREIKEWELIMEQNRAIFDQMGYSPSDTVDLGDCADNQLLIEEIIGMDYLNEMVAAPFVAPPALNEEEITVREYQDFRNLDDTLLYIN